MTATMLSIRSILRRYPPGMVLAAAGTCMSIGALSAFGGYVERPLLLSLILLLTVGPIIVRLIQGRLDIFEPLALICIAGFAMFFLRPVAQMITDESFYRNWDIRDGFNKALLIAAVGFSALLVGYALGVGGGHLRVARPKPRSWQDRFSVQIGVWLAAASGVLYGVFLVQSGAAATILSGRAPETTQIIQNSSGALYSAPLLAIPAALLFVQSGLETRRTAPWIFAGIIGVAFAAIMIPRGERQALLGFAIAVAAVPFLHRKTRPRWYSVAVVTVLAFFFASFLRDYRDTQVRNAGPSTYLSQAISNPSQNLDDLLLGADTEMFPNLALEASVVPSRIDFTPGRALTSAGGSLLPAAVFPAKPQPPDASFNAYFYPDQVRLLGTGSAVSYFGGLWYDSGFVGVLIGGILAGYLFGWLWRYLSSNVADPYARLVYAASLPFVVILLRGNPADSIPRALYGVGPLILLAWYLRAVQPRQMGGWRPVPSGRPAIQRSS